MIYQYDINGGKKMSPKFDIVTKKTASKSKIIIGFQVGIWGMVVRIGLYQER